MATNETRRTEEVRALADRMKREHEGCYTKRVTAGYDGPFCALCRDESAKPAAWPCRVFQLAEAVESQAASVERLRARVAEYEKLAKRAKEYETDHGKQSAVAIITSLASLAPEEGATT